MTDPIKVRRRVCRGRVSWNVYKRGEFFCTCHSEAAVRSTVERLGKVLAGGVS